MGNRIFADYNVPETPSASGGPGMTWKIFTGTKQQTGEPRSVWYFDKRSLEKLPKPEQEAALQTLKRDFSNLARLRHPLLLQVSKPLQDVGSALVVETEPIFASLANVMKNYKNLDPLPAALTNFTLEPLEIKLGIIQLCEALVFAHTSANSVHLSVSPEAIFLTPDGTWKLGCFCWTQFLSSQGPADSLFSYADKSVQNIVPLNPPLDFMAPECILLDRFDASSDMFSLGCVVFELFTKSSFLRCHGNSASYKVAIQALYPLNLDKVPLTLRQPLCQLLLVDPAQRSTAAEFLQSEFFNDVTIKTLHYVSRMAEKDERNKADFFKGLVTALPQFDLPVIDRKILPVMIFELKNIIMVPFILPCIFVILELVTPNPLAGDSLPPSSSLIRSRVISALIPLFTVKEPIQILLLLLQRADLLIRGLDPHSQSDHISQLFCFALDHENADIKLAALKVGAPIFASFTYDRLKNGILPRLESILSMPNIGSPLRVGALACLSKMIPLFSRNIVQDTLFPLVARSSSIDRTPAVQLATAGVCDVISKKFGDQITATQLLPLLTPALVDPGLNKAQFSTIHGIINGMILRIQQNRSKELEDKEKLQEEEASTKKLQSFDLFQKFSQRLESPDLALRAQTPPAAPSATAHQDSAATLKPQADNKSLQLFQSLAQRSSNSRSPAPEPQPAAPILDFDMFPASTQGSPLPPSHSSSATMTFSTNFLAPSPAPLDFSLNSTADFSSTTTLVFHPVSPSPAMSSPTAGTGDEDFFASIRPGPQVNSGFDFPF